MKLVWLPTGKGYERYARWYVFKNNLREDINDGTPRRWPLWLEDMWNWVNSDRDTKFKIE